MKSIMLQYSKFLPSVGMTPKSRSTQVENGAGFQMSWLGVSALTFSSSSREVLPSHIPLSLQGLTSFHMDFSHFWVNLLLLAALGKLKN